MSQNTLSAVVIASLAAWTTMVNGQSCEPHWDDTMSTPWTGADIYSFSVFDDGSGPALFACGGFSTPESGYNVAKWDGQNWSLFMIGVDVAVSSVVFDDGSGPALYVAGWFEDQPSCVQKWDGKTWTPIGNAGLALSLGVFDDGTGPALYASGAVPNTIAKWDGTQWSPLGTGVESGECYESPFVNACCMLVYDDGTGPALYAGGGFCIAGGIEAKHVARWNGKQWSAVGTGLNDLVWSLAEFDDGTGPALYAGGKFTAAGDTAVYHIAKWDGTAWSPVGNGMSNRVLAMRVFNDGSGKALFAGGTFTGFPREDLNRVGKWNGKQWSPMGSGVDSTSWQFGWARAFAEFDDGSGLALYVGGDFNVAGGMPAQSIARWKPCPPSKSSPGDVTGDGLVNTDDLLAVINSWGECAAPCAADVAPPGGNNIVDVDDLLVVINNWG